MDLDQFEIAAVDPHRPEVAELIGELTQELFLQFEHRTDADGHFDPMDGLPPRGIFLIGKINDHLAACGAFRRMEPGVVEIKRMYVRPAYRGLGLSKWILAELERLALTLGATTARLETGDILSAAIALYEGFGYRRIPRYGVYSHCESSICFEKKLK